MSEMIDLKKERNFFETRVIEYQSGGALSWDDPDRALSGHGRLHHTPHTHLGAALVCAVVFPYSW